MMSLTTLLNLDVGVFQHRFDPVDNARVVLHDLRSDARQVSQVAHLLRGHEAGSDQAVLEQISTPSGILFVRLAARHCFHVLRIGQGLLEALHL